MGILAEKAMEAIRNLTAEEEVCRLSKIPICSLKRPLAVRSYVLNETIYLVANKEMAEEVERQGKVAYSPEEVAVLLQKFREKDQSDWIVFLKQLHMMKKTFRGSRILS